MTKKKNLVIKSKSAMPLQIFEAADSTPVAKKYVFKGVFTACSTPDHVVVNRNNRIYGEQEVLRHLSYLRENIQQNGFILGELDHPIDRFDTQMKEASHKITDLWYDQPTHCVMGKLELLDTPNGQIARTLIDSGYPLFVSSRAAGEVDQKTKEVHIEQIFTYDIVCTPGFQEARLEKVEENLSVNARNYLNESLNTIKKDKNVTEKYGVLLEGVCVNESSVEAPILTNKAKAAMEKADINVLSKPMLKEDEEFKLPEANLDPNAEDKAVKENDEDNSNNNDDNKDADNKDKNNDNSSENNDKKDDKKSEKKELTDEEKKEKRAAIVSVEAFNANGESTTEEEKEENRDKVIDIEGVPAEDGDNKSDEDEKKSDDKNDVPGEDVEQTDECDGNSATTQECGDDNASECGDNQEECNPGDIKVKDGSKNQKDAEKVLNDADKSEDIKKQTEKDMDKYEEIIKKAKKLADVKESIVNAYNFSISLSPENFAKFAALKPVDKNKVQKYIVEHQIMDVKTINEQWMTPLVEEKRNKKNWLRLAPKEYREAYAKADMDVQDAIEESAKFVNIQTAGDAQRFWERTGLLHHDEYLQKSLTEQFAITESEDTNLNESAVRSQNLGYSVDYMGMLEQMADAGMI